MVEEKVGGVWQTVSAVSPQTLHARVITSRISSAGYGCGELRAGPQVLQAGDDVLVVTRRAGVEVTIDDVAIDDAAFVDAGGGFEVARVPTTDGVHALDSAEGFMVMVVGFDDADSYAYVDGTGTGVINPNPEG